MNTEIAHNEAEWEFQTLTKQRTLPFIEIISINDGTSLIYNGNKQLVQPTTTFRLPITKCFLLFFRV